MISAYIRVGYDHLLCNKDFFRHDLSCFICIYASVQFDETDQRINKRILKVNVDNLLKQKILSALGN